jgi:hypothetical protein
MALSILSLPCMKTLILFALALLCFSFGSQPTAMAQGKANYVAETHDFGEVIEGKVASHEFEFVNTGTAPIIIANVQASCGCTTPFWTKEPIAPGKKGIVKASYNSQGRPGPFNKSITVTSNAVEPTKVLSFKGNVLKKDQMPTVSEAQKENSAKLVFDRSTVQLGKLESGQSATARYPFTNKGKAPLEFNDVRAGSYSITWRTAKPSYLPSEQGVLEVTYTAQGNGPKDEELTVTSSDYNDYFQKLHLKSNVFTPAGDSPMQEERAVPFK